MCGARAQVVANRQRRKRRVAQNVIDSRVRARPRRKCQGRSAPNELCRQGAIGAAALRSWWRRVGRRDSRCRQRLDGELARKAVRHDSRARRDGCESDAGSARRECQAALEIRWHVAVMLRVAVALVVRGLTAVFRGSRVSMRLRRARRHRLTEPEVARQRQGEDRDDRACAHARQLSCATCSYQRSAARAVISRHRWPSAVP